MNTDLRMPLNTVISYSEALVADPAMPDVQVADYAKAINAAGRQLLNLADLILDMARVEAGLTDMVAGVVDIGLLVRQIVSEFTAQARAAQLVLTTDAPAGTPAVRGDGRRLADSLRHLIANAIRFTPPRGAVRVAVRRGRQGSDLLVVVSDTGIGIPPGDTDRLDRRFPGGGLGLYVTQITARAHGGDLVLRSDVGVGTTAILRLPKSRLVEPSALKDPA